ncbi:MAG TPA: response regulator, partial [Blastocatellia bacterium]|nr:response regulator [Blastocatellia bacterium]
SDLSGLYVIYVEDDVLVRASTVALLQEYRILHEAVGSFRELEARLGLIERVPDIVITDYRLPDGRTAQDVMRLIGEVFDFEVPVIVVSGEVIIASNQEFTPAALLTKPVSPDTLFAAILRIADQTSARSNLQTAQ